MKRTITILFCALLMHLAVLGETNWGLRSAVGVERKISSGLNLGLEAKYYLTDDFQNTDRWSMGVSLSKRLYRNFEKTFNVKATVGYKYMSVHNDWNTKYKGDDLTLGIPDGMDSLYYQGNGYDFNYRYPYDDRRHRVSASVQASWKLGRFKLSLRETYQYTHTDSVEYVKDKHRLKSYGWRITRDVPDGKPASDSQVLRSRIGLDYDIRHCFVDPFISYELFNDLDNRLAQKKSRLNAGFEFNINKTHYIDVSYMYQKDRDDDEPDGSFICVSYKLEF